jgi:CRP-like cAMP-binding protein
MQDSDGNRRIEVAMIGREGLVGIDAVFGRTAGPWTPIVSIANFTAMVMSVESFQRELADNQAFARVIRRYTLAFMHGLARSAACSAVHTVEQRSARRLLTLADRIACRDIPFTQEDLATRLGVRRATVSLTIAKFREQQLIECGRGRLLILNRRDLRAASCECYARLRRDEVRLLR